MFDWLVPDRNRPENQEPGCPGGEIRPLGLASRALIIFHQSGAVQADPRADRANADHQYRMACG